MRNVRNSHRDQRSRLQRRPHLFALASSVSVLRALTLGADSQRNVCNFHRDRRSRLQRRPHLSALVSSVSVFLGLALGPDSQRASQPKIWEEFSGDKALAHVQRLVDLGPRPPGSEAIEKARDYVEQQLRHSGWQVTRQAFTDDTPRGKIHFVNLIARFSGDANAVSPSFLLCSHYDTKLFEAIRFVGANDGGSSTGLLLELARVLGQHASVARNVELVFFDGEE